MFADLAPILLIPAAAAFFVGFLWHGPLFGKTWIKLMNIPQAEIDAAQAKGMKAMLPKMIGAYLQQVVVAWIMAGFGFALGMLTDALVAAELAFYVWLGFVATTLLNGPLWEGRSWKLYAFSAAYHLVNLIVISQVLVVVL